MLEEARSALTRTNGFGALAPLPQKLVHVTDRIAEEFGHPVPCQFRGVVSDRLEDPPVLMQTVILDVGRPLPAEPEGAFERSLDHAAERRQKRVPGRFE